MVDLFGDRNNLSPISFQSRSVFSLEKEKNLGQTGQGLNENERPQGNPENANVSPGTLLLLCQLHPPGLPGARHQPHLLQLPEELDWAGTLKQGPVEEGNSAAMDSQGVVREAIL